MEIAEQITLLDHIIFRSIPYEWVLHSVYLGSQPLRTYYMNYIFVTMLSSFCIQRPSCGCQLRISVLNAYYIQTEHISSFIALPVTKLIQLTCLPVFASFCTTVFVTVCHLSFLGLHSGSFWAKAGWRWTRTKELPTSWRPVSISMTCGDNNWHFSQNKCFRFGVLMYVTLLLSGCVCRWVTW